MKRDSLKGGRHKKGEKLGVVFPMWRVKAESRAVAVRCGVAWHGVDHRFLVLWSLVIGRVFEFRVPWYVVCSYDIV